MNDYEEFQGCARMWFVIMAASVLFWYALIKYFFF